MTKMLVVGHSHILALQSAARDLGEGTESEIDFILLREAGLRAPPAPRVTAFQHKALTSSLAGIDQAAVATRIAESCADVAALCINGNEHAILGLISDPAVSQDGKLARVERSVGERLPVWLDFLLPLLPRRVFLYPSPPPVSAERLEDHFPPEKVARLAGKELEVPAFRLRLWQHQCEVTRRICAARGIAFVEPPVAVFDASGLLAPCFWGRDPTHGNAEYGRHMVRRLREVVAQTPSVAAAPASGRGNPASHPYATLPATSFWKESVTQVAPCEMDPVLEPPFLISRTDRVATAGSCFAQHISRHLRRSGFRYFVAESTTARAGSDVGTAVHDFSARYGNLYTARQLLQLFDRAFGYFRPLDRVWQRHDGGFCDPFRPRIEPQGFGTEEELLRDLTRHLNAVKRMFRKLDVLVFTLGLTECWLSRLDGAAYPVAPGVVGGEFDPELHVFANFSVREVVADLEAFVAKLKLVNPEARIILTVSPVPLVATAEDRHVLASTVYSKSVLRVAAEEVSRAHDHVCYFPSYEIITGPHAAGGYFEADRRSVTEAGVEHVMRVFMRRMTAHDAEDPGADSEAPATAAMLEMEALAETSCDEEALAR